jgi:hypothetical protein
LKSGASKGLRKKRRDSMFKYIFIFSVYQCLDRIVDVQFCENSARIGGCDEENIGIDPIFTSDNWN